MKNTMLTRLYTLIGESKPNSATTREALAALNAGLKRIYEIYPWPQLMKEMELLSPAETSVSVTLTNGSTTITASSGLPVRVFDAHWMRVGSVEYKVGWIKNGTLGYLEQPFAGTTGTYAVMFFTKDLHLPEDAHSVRWVSRDNGVTQIPVGSNQPESAAYPTGGIAVGPGFKVPVPYAVEGVTTGTTTSAGVRTIVVYMAYSMGLNSFEIESELSPGTSFSLSATQSLVFAAPQTPNTLGLYTTYYFTCVQANILRPMRIPDAAPYFAPDNVAMVTPDLTLSSLTTSASRLTLVPHSGTNGVYTTLRRPYGDTWGDRIIVCYQKRVPVLMNETDTIDLPYSHEELLLNAAAFEYYKLTNPDKAGLFDALVSRSLVSAKNTTVVQQTVWAGRGANRRYSGGIW